MIFINYDSESELDSIEYSIVLNSDFISKVHYFKSETLSSTYTTQKNFIYKFFDEMKDKLIKLDISSKLIIVAAYREDLAFLCRKMKKAGYKIPNIFQNNVIELFPKDFADLGLGDFKEALNVFYTQYLIDPQTIKNKIRIINNT